ncbi:MAG: AAA family ATPase [Actinomycetota bacterium]|nr:AAA family ATPase [Actinomycetota bacterium]
MGGDRTSSTGEDAAHDELRPVTVLFADIVGSTALGERLAPDEVKALVGECVSMMSRAVEEYGGSVQAYMGDGICAYFGVPRAHEDDPERAARAALRIRDVVREYARDVAAAWGIEDFNVRVGINSGQTAVGLVGADARQAVALGDAANVAARLEAAAEPGTIVVGDATSKRLAQRFLFEPLGELTVKGRAEAVRASRLIDAGRADRTVAPPPLADREVEVARLRAAVDEVISGRGQVLLLLGEPGIGKTRMLEELRAIAGERVTWLQGNCLSYGGLPSWPFIEMLRRWLGVEEGEAEIALRTKARARLGAVLDAELADVLPALGRLLGIRLEPELDDHLRDSRQALSEQIQQAYLRWVEALMQQQPVVLAVEDLHWADASARELADALLELTDRGPLLLATTLTVDPASEGARFRLRVLTDYAHRATELLLGPLPDAAASDLLDRMLPGALDDASRATIVAQAEGNPLYLEELLRALVEGGAVEQRRRTWTITVRSRDLLPPALENVLVARIDRLPQGARRFAQVAAVVGRTFPVRVVARVAQTGDWQEDLAALLRSDIVREVRRYPEFEAAFRHGLMQEAALSTLPAARRTELSARVASTFEEFYASALDDHLERLAHYHAQAANGPKALEYLEQAAENAADLDARGRARDLFRRARKLALDLGDRAAGLRIDARLATLGR